MVGQYADHYTPLRTDLQPIYLEGQWAYRRFLCLAKAARANPQGGSALSIAITQSSLRGHPQSLRMTKRIPRDIEDVTRLEPQMGILLSNLQRGRPRLEIEGSITQPQHKRFALKFYLL